MISTQVVIYPRGFLGYNIGLPIQREETDLTKLMNNIRYNRPSLDRGKTVIANTDIESLAELYRGGDRSIRSMEFREKVLVAAMQCFGTQSFYDWCKLQQESPYFTDLHKRFLNDTLGFIASGERRMDTRAWKNIITVRVPNPNDDRVVYEMDDYFKMKLPAAVRRPFDVARTIADWTSQPGGFEDMIATLRIIFGTAN